MGDNGCFSFFFVKNESPDLRPDLRKAICIEKTNLILNYNN